MNFVCQRGKWVAVVLICSLSLTGCARLKGNTVYEYVPSLPSGSIPATVLVEEFQDLRPEWDRKQTRDVEPVATKLTRKVYDDLKASELFSDVTTKPDQNPDLILKGKIHNFYWKNRYKWYSFVPYLNLILLFGVPAGQFKGEVRIHLELVSQKTGASVGSYEETAFKEDTYTGYRLMGGALYGTETSESLRVAIENIKNRMLSDKDSILAAI